MKKMLLITNVVTLCLLYYSSCTNNSTLYDPAQNSSFTVNNSPGYGVCYNCPTDNIHGETPHHFADATRRFKCTATDFYENYMKGQSMNFNDPGHSGMQVTLNAPHIDNNYTGSRSCWFPTDTIKKFICLIEKFSAQRGITPDKLGIRFYYGIYDNNYQRDQSFRNKQTLFLVPTCYTAFSNWDFDPREFALAQSKSPILDSFTLAAKLRHPVRANQPAMILGANSLSNSMNEGDLCPPKTGCNSTINTVDTYFGTTIYQ